MSRIATLAARRCLRLSAVFERAVQSVAFALTLPYWDPTIENEAQLRGELRSVYETPLFTPHVFGTIAHHSSELNASAWRDDMWRDDATFRRFAIQDGRWAFATVGALGANASAARAAGAGGAATPSNSYGLLRAPWNNNPSPYVARFAASRGRRG